MSTKGDCFTEVDVLCGPANTYLFYEDLRGLYKISECLLQVLIPRCSYLYISVISLMSWYATLTLNFVRLFFMGIVSIFCMSYKAQNFDGGKAAVSAPN